MTSHEKALNAVNRRIERIQANLCETDMETGGRFLFQSLVVTVAVGEALNDFLQKIGEFAKRRHAELKQQNEALAARHEELLKAGQGLLEQLKANPGDRALRKEIERAQQDMAAVQKSIKRGANALQRDVRPSVGMIDAASDSVRKFSDAEQNDALKRVLKTVVGQVREFYASHPELPAKNVIDAATWETAAKAELDQAAGFHDAFSRVGSHVVLALELMAMAVSPNPPASAEDATKRANEAVSARLSRVTARFTSNESA